MNGFLPDTNVVSELRKGARADAGLAAWFGARHRRELFLSAVTLAELRRGVALISHRDPAQSDLLRRWCDRNGVRSERGQALKRKSQIGTGSGSKT